ncbi:MAG TPA: Hsp20/alpha crystallin family protein [Phycisphaerae bacterium]|jgi:HSP20 family protein
MTDGTSAATLTTIHRGCALDVKDSESEVIVKAEIPGVDAKNVDISLSGNVLTISGQKEELKEEKGEDYFVSERNFGSFRRSLELPQTVDPEKITAEQDNGVLTVKIGKLKIAKPRRIPVKVMAKAGA